MAMLKKILKLVSVGLIIVPLCLSDAASQGTQYQKRLLGDKAFDSGLYDVAMNYYENYLKDATGDSPAIRDAYYCLISTCLRSNNIPEAKKLYKELSIKFEQYYLNHPDDQRELKFWEGEIFMAEDKFDEANKIFTNLLEDSTDPTDDLSLRILTGEATSLLRMGDMTKARMLFSKLKDLATKKKNLELSNLATEEIIMIDLMNGNYKEAKLIITEETDTSGENATKLDMLNIYALASEGNLKDARALYEKIKPSYLTADQLWFFVTYSLAISYIKNSQGETASNIIDDAFALAPDMYDKEQAAILKIDNFIGLNKYAQAITASKMFLDAFPNSSIQTKILLVLAEAMIKEKQFNELYQIGGKYFSFTVTKNPEVMRLAQLFGKNSLEIQKYGDAGNYFNFIIKNSTDVKAIGEAQFWKTQILFDEKNYDQAMEGYKTIEKKYPFLKENSLLREAQIYIAQNKYNEAEDILKSLLKEYPDSQLLPSPQFMYAITMEKAGKNQDAIDQFIKYAEKNPGVKDANAAYYQAGSIALMIQKPDAAVGYFEKIVSTDTKAVTDQDALYKLVYANLLLKNFNKATKYAEFLSKNYPGTDASIQSQFWLADYYIKNKKYDNAIDKLEAIIKENKNPSIISSAYYKEGFTYYVAGDTAKSLIALQLLQAKYPDSKVIPISYYLQGDVLSSMGKYQDAISAYEEARDKAAKDSDLVIASTGRIGDCYFATLNYTKDKGPAIQKAIAAYQDILNKLDISIFVRTQTLYKLGKSYELLDNTEKAIESYHEAFYSNIICMEQGKDPSKIWMVKSAIALIRLLQEENTPEGASAAIKVLKELVKFNIEPVSDFQQRIEEIKSLYKLKE